MNMRNLVNIPTLLKGTIADLIDGEKEFEDSAGNKKKLCKLTKNDILLLFSLKETTENQTRGFWFRLGWQRSSVSERQQLLDNMYCQSRLEPIFANNDQSWIKIKNLKGAQLNVFNEIQNAKKHDMFPTVIILSRILIAHIAVDKGALSNQTFGYYEKYISNKHLVGKHFIPHLKNVRLEGNQLNHHIEYFENINIVSNKEKAKLCFQIICNLLEHIYAFEKQ